MGALYVMKYFNKYRGEVAYLTRYYGTIEDVDYAWRLNKVEADREWQIEETRPNTRAGWEREMVRVS